MDDPDGIVLEFRSGPPGSSAGPPDERPPDDGPGPPDERPPDDGPGHAGSEGTGRWTYQLARPQRPAATIGTAPPWEWLRVHGSPGGEAPPVPPLAAASWAFLGTGCLARGGRGTGATRHLMLAFTSARPGREDEYDRWYTSKHMAEIVALIPGYVSARRYVSAGPAAPDRPACPWRYLGLYHVECDDVAEFHRVDADLRSHGALTPDGGLRADSSAVWLYTAVQTGR